jgi:hypothetical protein
MKKLSLALLLLGSVSNAHEINMGHKVLGDRDVEVPILSFKHEEDTIKIRVRVNRDNVKCTPYRTDLCGFEDQVSMVEIVTQYKNCQIAKSTLIDCHISGSSFKPDTSVNAILENGTTLALEMTDTTISVGELTTLKSHFNEPKVPVTSIYLDFSLWGHRADGLSPLVEVGLHTNRFVSATLQLVKASLFDGAKK